MASVTHAGTTWTTAAGDKTVVATPAVNDLIVVVAPYTTTGTVTAGVTDNNSDGLGTYTQVDTDRTGFSTGGHLKVWVRNALVGSASSTTFTAAQVNSSGGGLTVFRVSGMTRTGADAVRSAGGQSSGTTGTTPAPVLNQAALTGNPIITAVCNGTNGSTTVTPRASFTEASDLGYTTPANGFESAFRNSGETTATMTHGSTTASTFASVAIELDTSSPPVNPFTVTLRQTGTNGQTAGQGSVVSSSATPTANSLFIVAGGVQVDAHTTLTLPVFSTPTGGSLTYTSVDKDGDTGSGYLYATTDGFWCGGAVYRAPIGGSPSAFTVTFDATSGATTGFHSVACFDITGHNAASPIVQTAHNGGTPASISDTAAGTVTFASPVTAGNLIVVCFMPTADANGAPASPTAGAGKTFTTITSPSSSFSVTSAFYRLADGAESQTITCSDLGTQVGNWTAVAFEVAVASNAATPSAVAAVASIPAPTVSLGALVTAALVAAVAAVPAPSVSTATHATATPSVVSTSASVPAPTMHTGSVISAAVAAALAAVPTPSVSSGSNANVSASVVASAASVPSVTIQTGSKATPTVVTGTAAVASPTMHTSMTASPAVVARAATVPTAAVVSLRYVTGIAANRYFTDQNGVPILVRGESPWAMFTKLSSSEMDTYLGNRASYGCNLALVSMIGATANGAPADTGATYDGILPFTGGNPTVFNSTYWSRMDSYIAKARDLGITLLIYPMDGWNTAFASVVFNPGSISNAQCQTYGQTLATRYLSYPNIMWAFGGDYNEDATINARYDACLTGIRAAGDTRPASIQLLYETSESHNSSFWETRVNWDLVYTYYVTYKGVSDGYNYTWSTSPTTRPALFTEGAYENSFSPHNGTDAALRRQACWALTSGSPGDFTGQEGVWNFQSGWASILDTTAADQIKAIRDTFEPLRWWTLIPDDANQLVTAGRGTRVTTDSATFPESNNYVTAARAPDGSLAAIYMPNASSAITVDMTKIGSSPTATWVDPTNGATTSATVGSSYSKGNNAAGSTDWLLILTGTGSATPSVVTGTATVPSVTMHTGSTATPAVVAGTAAVPSVTMHTGATATPSVVAAPATVPTPTVQTAAGATATPSVVAGVATVPSVTVQASTSATATPAVVAGTAAVPSVTMHTGMTPASSVVASTATVPSVTVTAGSNATVSASVVVGTAALPAASLTTGSVVAASVVTAATGIPAPAVTAGGNATVAPSVVTATAAVPAVSLTTSSKVTASVVAAVASTPAAVASGGSGALATVSAVSVAAVVPAPTVRLGALPTPVVVQGVASVGSPVGHASVLVSAVTVVAVATMPAALAASIVSGTASGGTMSVPTATGPTPGAPSATGATGDAPTASGA